MEPIPAPSREWIEILTGQGLAIMLVVFAVFIVFPAVAYGITRIVKWIAAFLDRGWEKYVETITTVCDSVKGTATIVEEVKDLIHEKADIHIGQLEKIHSRLDGAHCKAIIPHVP